MATIGSTFHEMGHTGGDSVQIFADVFPQYRQKLWAVVLLLLVSKPSVLKAVYYLYTSRKRIAQTPLLRFKIAYFFKKPLDRRRRGCDARLDQRENKEKNGKNKQTETEQKLNRNRQKETQIGGGKENA